MLKLKLIFLFKIFYPFGILTFYINLFLHKPKTIFKYPLNRKGTTIMKNSVTIFLTISIITIIFFSVILPETKIFGRPVWHTPKKIIDYELDGEETNQQIFDIYSFSHTTHGIILYFLLQYLGFLQSQIFYLAVTLEILWEIFENTPYVINKYRKTFTKYKGDSIVNIIGDVIFTVLGLYLTHLSPQIAVIYAIVAELILYPYGANFLYLSVGSLLNK